MDVGSGGHIHSTGPAACGPHSGTLLCSTGSCGSEEAFTGERPSTGKKAIALIYHNLSSDKLIANSINGFFLAVYSEQYYYCRYHPLIQTFLAILKGH